jgi:protein-tyrosine-phosphatase
MNVEQIRARAAVHAALGDPTRLAVAQMLVTSDRAPSSLAATLGLGSNLLAHHVNVLVRAGVVERLRSRADRRKTYLRLTGVGRSVLPVPTGVADGVTFVCTHNAARSQLAEALWRRRSVIPARSAGTHPDDRVHPGALRVAARRGLDLRGQRPRALHEEHLRGAVVVTVCDDADEALPVEHLHWSVPDPAATGRDADFDLAFDLIARRVELLGDSLERR